MRSGIPLMLVTLAGAAALGCGSGGPETAVSAPGPGSSGEEPVVRPLGVEPRMPAGARTHEDGEARLRVTLPADWHRASAAELERLSSTSFVLAVGTSPIRADPAAACGDAPGEPRAEVAPDGALIVVEEDAGSRAELARERPRFQLLEQAAPPERAAERTRRGVLPWDCRNRVGVSGLHEPSFADGGRVFSVTAIVGPDATDETRGATLAVLDSLAPLGG